VKLLATAGQFLFQHFVYENAGYEVITVLMDLMAYIMRILIFYSIFFSVQNQIFFLFLNYAKGNVLVLRSAFRGVGFYDRTLHCKKHLEGFALRGGRGSKKVGA
jgi:hypothetical protein